MSLSVPKELIETFSRVSDFADDQARKRWQELGAIDVEEIVGNSELSPSSVEEYLKY